MRLMRAFLFALVMVVAITATGIMPCFAQSGGSDASNGQKLQAPTMDEKKRLESTDGGTVNQDDVPAEPEPSSEMQVPANRDSMKYAFLHSYSPWHHGKLFHWMQDHNVPMGSKVIAGEPVFRPFVYWAQWSNRPQRFGVAFALFFVVSALAWSFLPKTLGSAEIESSTHYWRSLGMGLLVTYSLTLLIRIALRTEIGWPLAILLIGSMQLALLLGGAIICSMIGKTIAKVTKVSKWGALANHPNWRSCLIWFMGAIALAALLQLGSPLGLPRLGTRLVVLLATVGIGALYRSARKDALPQI